MSRELEKLAAQLGEVLSKNKIMMATAESCTGGWIAQVITSVAGSSVWFDRGFVTYSNESKQDMLGVCPETLRAHGAVSEEVVREMVAGALENSRAEIAVAVSGVAGPGGGSEEKPLGTVWLAWQLDGGSVLTKRMLFSGDRTQVREQTVLLALQGAIELVQ